MPRNQKRANRQIKRLACEEKEGGKFIGTQRQIKYAKQNLYRDKQKKNRGISTKQVGEFRTWAGGEKRVRMRIHQYNRCHLENVARVGTCPTSVSCANVALFIFRLPIGWARKSRAGVFSPPPPMDSARELL